MNWFKRIFCGQEEFNGYVVDQWGLPFVKDVAPMPKVKPPKSDISEPVLAMVQSMFDHPHTWKVERDITLLFHPFTHYNVKDIKTGINFSVIYYHSPYKSSSDISGLSWATKEEGDYLISSLETMHKLKVARVERIKQVKKNVERDKVKELYK